MRGVLDAFTRGEWLVVSENPYDKTKDTVLARVDPVNREVWDIRCIEPKPGIRVFGRFCARDEFIALTWEYRENINGRDFDRAVDRCRQKWMDLFPGEPLFGGASINAYLSANFRVV